MKKEGLGGEGGGEGGERWRMEGGLEKEGLGGREVGKVGIEVEGKEQK